MAREALSSERSETANTAPTEKIRTQYFTVQGTFIFTLLISRAILYTVRGLCVHLDRGVRRVRAAPCPGWGARPVCDLRMNEARSRGPPSHLSLMSEAAPAQCALTVG